MEHPKEEELIAFHDGDRANRERLQEHLSACAECRTALDKLEAVFAAMDSLPIPDPGENYGQRVWAAIAPRLPEKQPRWWENLFAPRRLMAVGAFAAIVAAAYIAGRWSKPQPPVETVDTAKVRERILVVAVGDHLSKSEMFLVELSNAQPNPASGQLVNISATQKRAEDLLDENRLYRQTALKEGDQLMASTLDELERVLLDIANSPDKVTPARFESMQQRLASRGILFKVRVIQQGLQDRAKSQQKPAQKQPQNISKTMSTEGNKV
ncbi:MAG TPA: zf-HC2 domain-containing protein [Candidatus Acidoferrum sp.]|nr:zf-HC2 domain-containing protein [Candidatus Acidoferrum sp.]